MALNKNKNRFSAAMRHPLHVISAAAVFALSIAELSFLPLLIGLAAEAVYVVISLIRAAGVHITVDPETERSSDANQEARSELATSHRLEEASPAAPFAGAGVRTPDPVAPPAGVKIGFIAAPADTSPADSAHVTVPEDAKADPLTSRLQPGRQAQLEHLDATYRLIGLRTNAGPASTARIGEGLTQLRQMFISFALSEGEIDRILQQFSADTEEDEQVRPIAPGSGPGAFTPSLEGLVSTTTVLENSGSGPDRAVLRRLTEYYDAALQEIGWQRQQLPPGSRASEDLDAHATQLLQRRKFVGRAGTLLTSLHYEMDMIVHKAEAVYADIGMRQPSHIVSDLNAMLIQGKALARSLSDIGINAAPPSEAAL